MLLTRRFDRLEAVVYTALRILAGLMFACHGLQKLFGILGGDVEAIGSQLWIGGVIELGAGTLIALGLLTRPAAFVAAGQMAVAYFQFHVAPTIAEDPATLLPIRNGGDDTVLYCFAFLFICARGPGRVALDRLLFTRATA